MAKRDQLAAHLKELDDTNVSDAQITVTNELNDQIKRGDEVLASLKEAEKQLAIGAPAMITSSSAAAARR